MGARSNSHSNSHSQSHSKSNSQTHFTSQPQFQSHEEKVKITIECTHDERIYIKMLAARVHLNLSEFLLSYVRNDFPQENKPNKITLDAMRESKEGKGIKCDSIEDFWEKMGMNPDA